MGSLPGPSCIVSMFVLVSWAPLNGVLAVTVLRCLPCKASAAPVAATTAVQASRVISLLAAVLWGEAKADQPYPLLGERVHMQRPTGPITLPAQQPAALQTWSSWPATPAAAGPTTPLAPPGTAACWARHLPRAVMTPPLAAAPGRLLPVVSGTVVLRSLKVSNAKLR